MQKKNDPKEILRLTAKFRSRLDILWRIVIQICEGTMPAGRSVGACRKYDTSLLPLIGIDLERLEETRRPTYEEAVKIGFESIMADFYRIEERIAEIS